MPADDLDPSLVRLLDQRCLFGGVDAAQHDAVRLQGDGLTHGRRTG
jgi:hypothetical protein